MKQPPVIHPCENDPRHPPEWVCTSCGKTWCDQCIERIGLHKAYEICPACFKRCERLETVLAPPKRRGSKKSFARGPGKDWSAMLQRAWVLPLKSPGIILIAIGGAAFGLLRLLIPFGGVSGIMVAMFIYGYLAQYWLALVRAEATGEEGPLDPELDWDALISGCLSLFIFIPAILFGPALLAGWVGPSQLKVPLAALGAFMTPIALIAAALYDSVSAANPIYLIQGLSRVFLPYIMLCIWLSLSVGAGVWLFHGLHAGATTGFLSFGEIVLREIVLGVGQVYLLWVAGRLLGGFYRIYENRIGWSG
ncbi:MAG: hypothetical protein ACOX52_21030 [Verrucomicrobiota bacterium]|jgi:hypothetical protein